MVSRYWLKPAALMSYGLFVSRRTRGEVTSCLAVPLTGLDGGERQRGDRGVVGAECGSGLVFGAGTCSSVCRRRSRTNVGVLGGGLRFWN